MTKFFLFISFAFSCHLASAKQCIPEAKLVRILAPFYQERWPVLATSSDDINNIPQLRRCGLLIGINDLRFVTNFQEFVGIVEWGLNNAARIERAKRSASL